MGHCTDGNPKFLGAALGALAGAGAQKLVGGLGKKLGIGMKGDHGKIMHCGPGHQVGGGTFLSKHCANSNYKDKPAGGYQPLNYMSASYNDMGDSNKPKGKIAQKSGGAKPDYLDLDGDGNKQEPMKKAAKEK
jgi:hypothetical protein